MKQLPGKIFDTSVFIKMMVFVGINLYMIDKPVGPIYYAVMLLNLLAVFTGTFRYVWLFRNKESKTSDVLIPIAFLINTFLMYFNSLNINVFILILSINIITAFLLCYKVFIRWKN